MAEFTIVDTFSSFEEYWREVRGRPVDAQIDSWLSGYMSHWPELRDKQLGDRESDGLDWRALAREHVFPFLAERYPAVAEARGSLLKCLEPICRQAADALGLDFGITCVLYVGVGLGAGWATVYDGAPAVLFGLEQMAALNWTDVTSAGMLAAHEIGHLVHRHWREASRCDKCDGPFGDLCSEGFATECEHIILGREDWGPERYQPGWLGWCRENRSWLAREFLRIAEAGEPMNVFYGDWLKLRGWSQCGYFLGHEVIAAWRSEMGLKPIAAMGSVAIARHVMQTLRQMAGPR